MIQDVAAKTDEQNRMNSEQIAHLAGVFDTIGSISLSVVKDSDYRLGYTLRPKLRLRRANEDDPLLGKLMAYSDEQGVRYTIGETTHGAGTDRVSIEWTTTDPESIERFLEPLMDFLVTNYFNAELMLTEVLPALEADAHLEKESFYEMMELVEELRAGSSLRREPKYTQDYFAEEWSLTE